VDGFTFQQPFVNFGPAALNPWDEPLAWFRFRGKRGKTLRRRVRLQAPKLPGVYGMLNADEELIYVGKAKCLRTRLLCYFRPKSRDPKAGRILKQARHILCEVQPSEFAALHRELELIRRWRPRFNVQGQPVYRRRQFVCLGRKPAPYIFLARQPPAGVRALFGSVPGGATARQAVRWLNDAFGLRDCPQSQPMHFAEQVELFPVVRAAGCLRHEIGTCLGPCTGQLTRARYAQGTDAAAAFLTGLDLALLDRLHAEMTAASVATQFERAAALRDKWRSVRWLHEHLERLRLAQRQGTWIYSVRGHGGRDVWYVLHAGRAAAALPWPKDEAEVKRVKAALQGVLKREQDRALRQTGAEIEDVLLAAAWFRKYPQERAQWFSPGPEPTAPFSREH
jgi:excinuclease ABC subunit C